MGWLTSLLGSGLIKMLGDGILAPILAHLDKRTDADSERLKTLVAAEIETSRMRQAMAMGFPWLVYGIGGLSTLHYGAVILDSLPLFGHVVGSWSIPPIPGTYGTIQQTVLTSFFVLAPTAPLFRALAARLAR